MSEKSAIDSSVYDASFYAHRGKSTSYAAAAVLGQVLKFVPEVRSAVDFGCGSGVWLHTLRSLHPVPDVLGVDGPWVAREHLAIPVEAFREEDMNQPVVLDHRYDLAMSLEAAEHLYPNNAGTFVDTLCAASDFILFSAAVPGQEGKNHFNEQWPDYWATLFRARGYHVVDCLRGELWHDEQIPFWYRQNALLMVAASRVDDLHPDVWKAPTPLSIVHPRTFEDYFRRSRSIKESWKWLRRAIKRQWFGIDC